MSVSVAIAGASGYAGGEILRLLLNHPAYLSGELTIGALTGGSNAGTPLGELHPHLPQLADRTLVETSPDTLSGHTVVFLALPHGHSAAIGQALGEDTIIIDCGADFRLADAATFEKFYGQPHPGTWTYGLPELPGQRDKIAATTRVAVPGCFPTGATLALAPAFAADLIAPSATIVSFTGTSGAGKKASVAQLGAEVMGSAKAYCVAGTHRHTPEMAQNYSAIAGEEVEVSFTPVLAPMPRGILTTAQAELKTRITAAQVREAYERYCAEQPFLFLTPAGVQPATASIVGSNAVHIGVEINPDLGANGRLIVTAVIDNLTKGTAGGAVQCMNIICGFPDTAGLPTAGVAP